MKTRIPTHRKILAFFLSLLFLMSAAGTPLSVLGAEITEWVTQSTSEDKAPRLPPTWRRYGCRK